LVERNQTENWVGAAVQWGNKTETEQQQHTKQKQQQQ
jgi:hypothetical protein